MVGSVESTGHRKVPFGLPTVRPCRVHSLDTAEEQQLWSVPRRTRRPQLQRDDNSRRCQVSGCAFAFSAYGLRWRICGDCGAGQCLSLTVTGAPISGRCTNARRAGPSAPSRLHRHGTPKNPLVASTPDHRMRHTQPDMGGQNPLNHCERFVNPLLNLCRISDEERRA